MVTTLPPFVQNQTKEGIQWIIKDEDGVVIPIDTSKVSELTFTMWEQGTTVYKIRVNKTVDGQIEYETDGLDGICNYVPAVTDFDTVGTFLGELYIEFLDGTDGYIHELIIPVVAAAPTTAPP